MITGDSVLTAGAIARQVGLEGAVLSGADLDALEGGARILTVPRFAVLAAFGAIMAGGTLGVFAYGRSSGSEEHAKTLAFTTFVLFQFFNVFNARAERGTAFNARFFENRRLWWSLAGVFGFQVVVVELPAAQRVFHTASLALGDWALAFTVASSVLVFEESRKALVRGFGPRSEPSFQPTTS